MITDEFVVEKPSFVEIKLTGDNIILYDYLLEQRFVLSPIAYEMFLEFDGIKSIKDTNPYADGRRNTAEYFFNVNGGCL